MTARDGLNENNSEAVESTGGNAEAERFVSRSAQRNRCGEGVQRARREGIFDASFESIKKLWKGSARTRSMAGRQRAEDLLFYEGRSMSR
jgi:hypothetical protein